MKRLFKLGFLAFAITLTAAACNSNTTENDATDTLDSVADVAGEAIENQVEAVDSTAEAAVDSIQH